MTHLSDRETTILRLLSEGKTYHQIRDFLNIARERQKKPPISMENIHSTCWTIRKKTGIRQTQNPEECRAILRQRHHTHETPAPNRPTSRQMEVLRMVAGGKPYAEIAALLGLSSPQSAQNYASQGAKRAGIRVQPWQRTHAIRQWLAQYDAPPASVLNTMDDPAF